MATGLSLHIGINHPDPSAYPSGWEDLKSCEKVATDMAQLAASQGFWTRSLFTKAATASNILRNIESAALALEPGDIFLLTFAGHGSQIPDENGDEEDGFDETWVAYDRMIVDDELFFLWSRFKPRTRILVISDSCHSGTITSVPPSSIVDVAAKPCKEVPALLSTEAALELFFRNRVFYQAVQQRTA